MNLGEGLSDKIIYLGPYKCIFRKKPIKFDSLSQQRQLELNTQNTFDNEFKCHENSLDDDIEDVEGLQKSQNDDNFNQNFVLKTKQKLSYTKAFQKKPTKTTISSSMP